MNKSYVECCAHHHILECAIQRKAKDSGHFVVGALTLNKIFNDYYSAAPWTTINYYEYKKLRAFALNSHISSDKLRVFFLLQNRPVFVVRAMGDIENMSLFFFIH